VFTGRIPTLDIRNLKLFRPRVRVIMKQLARSKYVADERDPIGERVKVYITSVPKISTA
jgi:hypothetical protein